jgi:hypothetical protein
VLTNPARFDAAGVLRVTPCQSGHACAAGCSTNMCKAELLRRAVDAAGAAVSRVVYIGDGANDAWFVFFGYCGCVCVHACVRACFVSGNTHITPPSVACPFEKPPLPPSYTHTHTHANKKPSPALGALGAGDVVFARRGFALDKALAKSEAAAALRARCVRWESGLDILHWLQAEGVLAAAAAP